MGTIRQPSQTAGYEFVCEYSALPARGKKAVQVAGESVLIVACETGLYAVENRCPQTGHPIAHGAVLDCAITVPTTGARYCLQTGRYLDGGQLPQPSLSLHVYPLIVHENQVYIRA